MRYPRHRTELQPLASILGQTLHRAGLGRVVLLSRIMQHWEDIVGPQLAAVAQPASVRSHVLFITVADAIWLQQLMFYQSQLLHNLRQALGDVSISRLHFSVAESSPAPMPHQTEAVSQPLPLTATEEQQVLEGTSGIADHDLRELIRRAWRKGWESGRWRT